METPKKTRVVWTTEELDRLRAEVTRLIGIDKTLRPIEAVHRAQDNVLPADRHRKPRHQSMFGGRALETIEAAILAGLRLNHDDALLLPVGMLARVATPAAIVTPMVPEHEPAPVDSAPAPSVPSKCAADFGTHELLAELLLRLGSNLLARFDRFEDAVLARIEPARPDAPDLRRVSPAPVPQPAPVPKPPMPIVAIVGLLKDQFEHVREKVAHFPMRLAFVDKESNRVQFPSCDYAIVQRHCGHRWWDAAQRIVNSKNLAFVAGGISETVQRVADFHSQFTAQAARR